MPRDIDLIIERLRAEIPGVHVEQLQVEHSGADDDGLWFIKVPDRREEIQLESPYGMCPFIIESDFNHEMLHARSVEEALATIKSLYSC
jgi:hypothetical protein